MFSAWVLTPIRSAKTDHPAFLDVFLWVNFMARARNIKPAFFTNEQVSENCPLGRLLFIGLWTMADYKGDLEWKEKTLKIQILPWDSCDLKELAINLDKSGLIRFYSDGVKTYINIPNFEKHQNPHKNERDKGSEVPAYCESMRQVIDLKELTINRDKSRAVPKCSHSDRADSPILIPDSGILKPDSVKPPTANAAADVFAHWQMRMNHPGAKMDAKRSKLITAAIKLGYTVEHLKAAIDGCAKSPFHMGNNDRHTVFDSIELIFRSADKIDTFIKLNSTEIKPGAGYEQPKSNLDKLIQQYGQQQPGPPPADYIDGEFLDSNGGDLWPTLGQVVRTDS